MNIIFLEAAQNFGGARKSTLELAKQLQNKGNTVDIIDFWGSCIPFIEEAKRLGLCVKFVDKRDVPIILSDPNKFNVLLNYVSYFYKWLAYRKKISVLIKKINPDLIIVNNVKVLSVLKKSDSYRITFFARGWFLPHTIPKINKIIIKRLVDMYIGVSQSTRQAIYAGGFSKLENIYVVPNGIDFNKTQRLLSSSKAVKIWSDINTDRPFILMHCGGFLKSKGQQVLIQIAQKLKTEKIKFKIMLVGIIYKGTESQKYYEELLEEISRLELGDNIDIILNEPDVVKYFAKTDVLIHPSSTEGLPRVVMEAMSLGKPVIGNAVGGMTDFILNGYTGFLTNYNSVDEYVEFIKLLSKDKVLYKTISESSKNLIKNSYDFENQLNSFNKINVF
ncbi:MAG: glycosyltransferase family 4 protein [Mesonia sp.]|uniref:glycosyltransferase family 4 protein n=1 Tax=Mesonia sp. TaxID=1960830 RepID=UPI003F9729C6